MSNITETTDATFQQDVVEASAQTPVLVDYWTDWCGPCKQLAPVLDRIADNYAGEVKVVKMDTVAHPQTAASRGVMGLPTLEMWVDGEVVAVSTGSQNAGRLTKMIDDAIDR